MTALTDSLSEAARPRVDPDTLAIDILHDIVATPSLSGAERDAIIRFAHHARTLGLQTEIDEAGNGIATRGPSPCTTESSAHAATAAGTAPLEIVLLGHIDTVPGAIPVRITTGDDAGPRGSVDLMLHGRGSVDAKGPLCAMLVAASRALLPRDVVLRVCAAVGEETPHSPGARHLARTLRPHACIVGEPSAWDGVTLGYKGRLVLRIDVVQPCHHSAGPGGSAPDAAHDLWSAVRSLVTDLNRDHAPAAPRAFDIIQSSLRSFTSSSDGLADSATLIGGFRLPRWLSPHELESRLRTLIQNGETISMAFEGHECAHAADRNDPVVRALSSSIRSFGATPHPKLKTGTADLNVVAPMWNCPIAAYGPGDSSLDHTPVERLSLAEYLRAIRVLTRAIETLASELLASRVSPT